MAAVHVGRRIGGVLALVAVGLLAAPPAAWLVRSWFEDGYGSDGEWVFLAVLGIAVWSWRSPATRPLFERDRRRVVGLLSTTALIRLAGNILAIHAIGALALVADVYALALALRLPDRRRSVSAGALSALFAFTLPVERLVQRGIGYPLQRLSVAIAAPLLRALEPEAAIDGVAIHVRDASLSIDLPCSGARGLVLLLTLAIALVAIGRIGGPRRVVVGLASALGGALGANTLRIVLLFEGVVHRPFSIDVLREPWHSLAGLIGLAGAVLLLLAQARGAHPVRRPTCGRGRTRPPDSLREARPAIEKNDRRPFDMDPKATDPETGSNAWSGVVLLVLAATTLLVPAHPVDVSRSLAPLVLPEHLGAWHGHPLPLEEKERAYFTAFGGQAAKMRYADLSSPGSPDRTVIAVRTTAPLRHLHPADECLLGRGHRVEHLGVLRDPRLPSTVYASVAPSGHRYLVQVSYVSEKGEVAASVAEVAWLWMKSPGTAWTMIERIRPAGQGADSPSDHQFLESIARALELAPKENST